MKGKKLLIVLIVLFVVGLGFLFSQRFHPAVYEKMKWLYGKEIAVTETKNLEGTSILTSELNNGTVLYCSDMGLHLSPKKIQELHFVSPKMIRSGDYIMVYDCEGTQASVYYKNKELYTVSIEHTICSAKVNEQGYAVLVSEQPGYQAVVSVYNRKGKNIYKVYSGEKFVLDADVYENGKRLAVSQYSVSGEQLMSTMAFYRLDEREPYQVTETGASAFVSVRFMENGKLLALGDSETVAFSANGEEIWNYEYTSGSLQTFCLSDVGIALVLRQQNQKIVMLNNSGKVCEYQYDGADVRYIVRNRSGVLCASGRSVFFLSKQGYRLAELQLTRDISEIHLEDSGKSGAILYESGYDLIKVK